MAIFVMPFINILSWIYGIEEELQIQFWISYILQLYVKYISFVRFLWYLIGIIVYVPQKQ